MEAIDLGAHEVRREVSVDVHRDARIVVAHDALDGRRARAGHHEEACRRVAEVVKAERTHLRRGPELVVVDGAPTERRVIGVFDVRAALLATLVLPAGDDPRATKRATEEAFEIDVGPHHRPVLLWEDEVGGRLIDGGLEVGEEVRRNRDHVRVATLRRVAPMRAAYPFLSYCEQEGGPASLAARGEVVFYTAGFPGPATVGVLRAVALSCPGASFRHWGDADVGGLRIWSLLREGLGVPVRLFRTTAAWFQNEAAQGATALTSEEERALHALRTTIRRYGDADDALALVDALLAARAKIEQERF